jgi:DNA helicase II / ATP-dependent DNA helicase PcrA
LLDRGTQMREQLSPDWRTNGAYTDALNSVGQAFLQEHFSTSMRKQSGVKVMNMCKAKGKQSDEVTIFEGWPRTANGRIKANPDRIVSRNADGGHLRSAKHNFRVSVTRARLRTTILTPESDPCVPLVRAGRATKALGA